LAIGLYDSPEFVAVGLVHARDTATAPPSGGGYAGAVLRECHLPDIGINRQSAT
jgi:hypothetical protein